MRRREFIALLFGGTIAGPFRCLAQAVARPALIGLVPIGSPSNPNDQALVNAFRQGLREVGLVENQDVTIDIVWVSKESEFPQVMAELVQRGAKILMPAGTSAAVAAKRETSSIPIVFLTVGDPIGIGIVETLARPGGNATGFSDVLLDLSSKYVDLARQLSTPPAAVVDYVWYAEWANGPARFQAAQRAAQSLRVELRSRTIADAVEMTDALAAMKKGGAATVIVQPGPFTYRHRKRLIESAIIHGLGLIFAWPDAAREGALMGYGPDYAHMYRGSASYVDRILKGTKPADLPVEQPSKFQLIVNVKTAKALGREIPSTLLTIADEVIE